jgi:hypothetical protein
MLTPYQRDVVELRLKMLAEKLTSPNTDTGHLDFPDYLDEVHVTLQAVTVES